MKKHSPIFYIYISCFEKALAELQWRSQLAHGTYMRKPLVLFAVQICLRGLNQDHA